jgi:hypothetical protein
MSETPTPSDATVSPNRGNGGIVEGAAAHPALDRGFDPDAIGARVRAARKEKDKANGRRRVSKPFRELVKADRRVSRAAHRLTRAAAKGLRTYRDEQDASAEAKRDGAVRDQPRNAAKGLAVVMVEASQVPVDLARAMSTRTGTRLVRRTLRLFLAPLG